MIVSASPDQVTGYDNEVTVCAALLKHNIPTKPNPTGVLERFLGEIPKLQTLEIFNGHDIEDLYASIMAGYSKYLEQSTLKSLIHNNINPRNILIDHKDRDVISLIDWDHICFGEKCHQLRIFLLLHSFEMAGDFVLSRSIKQIWR